MDISEVVNIILSGGPVDAVAAIDFPRATAEKAKAEASKLRADAEMVCIDSAKSATRILIENIVKPLKNEFNETKEGLSEIKKELVHNTREIARLREAFDDTNGYEHHDGCPIPDWLHERPKEHDRERGGTDRDKRQHRGRDASCNGTVGAEVGSESDPECGQSP